MTLWSLILREIRFRQGSFTAAIAAAALAAACLAGTVGLLDRYDARSARLAEEHVARTQTMVRQRQADADQRAAELEEAYRKIMLKFGYNLAILPAEENVVDYQVQGAPAGYMDEDRVRVLADSGILTVRHLLPVIQQRQIVVADGRRQEVFLVGTRGEVPIGTSDESKPLQQAVGPGQMIVGAEVQRQLGLNVGQKVRVVDAEFTVSKCYEPRGTADDSTVWIELGRAQALLGKPGKINGILALSCLCKPAELDDIRKEIVRILPGTQVRVMMSSAVIRYEARARAAEAAKNQVELARRQGREDLQQAQRARAVVRGQIESFAGWLVPLALVVCAGWTALLATANLRERKAEVGILRALGVRSRQVLALFAVRALMIGVAGAVLGYAGGLAIAGLWDRSLPWGNLGDLRLLGVVLLVVPVTSAAASWVPAMQAARQDPAVILREP